MTGSPTRNIPPGTWAEARKKRFEREWKLGRFTLELSRFINRQCLSFGGGFNWNHNPSLEIDLLLWRVYIEYQRRK